MSSHTTGAEPTYLEEWGSCEEDYGASRTLQARLWQLAEEKCIPLSATIEITLRCNLRCVHCYNFDRALPYRKAQTDRDLNGAEIIDIIDQLADMGCLYLSFSGGEPLLHPQLANFVQHARMRRFAVKVKTNGMLLTPKRVQMLANAGTLGVDASLHGATAETHDGFTRQSGSFEKTVQGIRTTRDTGLDVRVNISLVRSNAAEVQAMIDLVEGLGLVYRISPYITARYDGTTSSLDEGVDRQTLEALYRGPLSHLIGKPNFDPNRSVQCACARSVCGISATGEVYPCIGAPIPSGNLRRHSFAEIWRHSHELNWIRGLELGDFTACKPCPDRSFCKRSSGVVYTNTGIYTGPEEFTCMDAATRHAMYVEQ